MIEINELQFDNDDIGRLAVHIGRTHAGKPARAIPLALTAAGGLAYSGSGVLYGYSIQNTDGANPVTVSLHDATDVNGPLLLGEEMATGVIVTKWLGRPGLIVQRGLFVASSTIANVTLFLAAHGLND